MINSKKEQQKEQEKHIYIAIDSDVLRHLTLIDKLLHKKPDIEIRKATQDITISRFGDYLKAILKAAKEDKIRLLIVNTVYQESCHSEDLVRFMKNYCYFPKLNVLTQVAYAQEIEKLAIAYTKPYFYRDEMHEAPMKATYSAHDRKFVPTNDTYIMAEATVENACVLTGNEKDFVTNKRNNVDKNHDRVNGIVAINAINGYFEKGEHFAQVIPKPFTIPTLGTIVTKYLDNFDAPVSLQDTKISGKEFFKEK